ncbi:hypothetical protein BSL78_24607 [Apostichopus japonicus]|uniref:Uncharacterized protein n=1 Tax=Stichopus japonicus TaxID=307972 RepID=A0A2G8JS04_STIJA|nr:hypothetical protein BSL78_24607 [Apostichopus japonicus]
MLTEVASMREQGWSGGGKALVIILTFPSASNAKKHPHYLMREVLKEAALHHRDKYHKKYQFVYMEDKAFMQELILTSLEIPSVLVFDPATYFYYLMDEPEKVSQESLEEFLKSVEEGLQQAYGGNSFFRRLYRVFYEIVTSVAEVQVYYVLLTWYKSLCMHLMRLVKENDKPLRKDPMKETSLEAI